MPLVYLATNLINGKRYVGFTRKTLVYRRYMHFQTAKGSNKKTIFTRAIRKYGEAAFEFSVLEEFETLQGALDAERKYIADLKPEYNISIGGIAPSGIKWTASRRKKFSKSAIKSWTPERKAHQSKIATGRKRTAEQIAAMRLRDQNHLFKSIICLNDGVFFVSIKAAAKHYGVRKAGIHEVLVGRQLVTGGLSFVYSDSPMTKAECKLCLDALDERRTLWNARRNKDKARPVDCLTDGKRHDSGIAAAKFYGISPMRIVQICQRGGATVSGLSFKYADQKEAPQKRIGTEAEKEQHRQNFLAGLRRSQIKQQKRVKCIDTGEVYESIIAASKACGIHGRNLYQAIARGQRSAGLSFALVQS